ncbi:MAG: hypothetical protein ACRDQ0_18845, partial [Pseudonocardia sp.]
MTTTTIPRWTTGPRPGTGVHRTSLPDDLVAGIARRSGVSPRAVALAAHAAVLAALSGEREV